jgi:methylmalonyl-CoA/ethylmalonyl-CoA epimerase
MYQVALTSSDLERSTKFYRDILGLRLLARFDPPGLAFFAVGEGDRQIRLSIQHSSEPESVSSVIYFRVPDAKVAAESLQDKGVALEREAELVFRDDEGTFGNAGEEEWMAFFRDPDGNLLAFVSRTTA